MVVFVDKTGDLAFVTIDNPPINAANHGVRTGLMAAIAQAEADDAVRAVVLRGAGRTFTAGADVREFNKPPVPPHLPDVICALEDATKPWIAALHGTVLGGGLEIALGCTARCAAVSTQLGFPEVNLGLIPGAGGTVRLPRLIDPLDAMIMVSGGKPVSAKQAYEIGLIDAVADGNVTQDAIAMARAAIGHTSRPPLRKTDPRPISDPAAFDKAKQATRRKAKGAKAPAAAIAAIETALTLSGDAALAQERNIFLKLKSDPQSAALRHIFFAERSVGKLPVLKGVAPHQIDHIGVVGGGTMGAGIAANSL